MPVTAAVRRKQLSSGSCGTGLISLLVFAVGPGDQAAPTDAPPPGVAKASMGVVPFG